MTIIDWLALLIATPAIAAMVAIFVAIGRRKSSLLLRFTGVGRLSLPQWVLAIFACFGFVFCFYSGAAAALSWVPDSWGIGEFSPLNLSMAGLFGVFGGVYFFLVSVESVGKSILQQITIEEDILLNKVRSCGSSPESISYLRKELEEKIRQIEKENPNMENRMGEDPSSFAEQRKRCLQFALRKLASREKA